MFKIAPYALSVKWMKNVNRCESDICIYFLSAIEQWAYTLKRYYHQSYRYFLPIAVSRWAKRKISSVSSVSLW